MPRLTAHATPNCTLDGSRTFAQVRCKVPIGYNGASHIRPQNYPLPWTYPQTQSPASSLDLSDLPSQTASISDQPCIHNALTDTQTDRQTNRWLAGMVYNYKPLTLYRERHSLIMYKMYILYQVIS